MVYVGTPISNALNETYSGLPFCGMPLAMLLSLASPAATIDYATVIRNTQQPIYEIKMISPVTYQTANIKLWDTQMTTEFKPKTEFVKKLLALRRQSLKEGMMTFSVDEILAEKHALRGEFD